MIGIIRNCDRSSCQYWNNIKQRNDIFFDCANSLRLSAVNLIETIQAANRKTNMHVNTIRVNVPDKGPDTIYRILKREAVDFHLIIEDFVSKSVPHMQSQGSSGSITEFENLYKKGMNHFGFIQGATNCLQDELDKTNQSYNINNIQPHVANTGPSAIQNNSNNNNNSQQSQPAGSFDIDNVLSEFENAANSLDAIVNSGKSQPEIGITNSTISHYSISPATSNPVESSSNDNSFENKSPEVLEYSYTTTEIAKNNDNNIDDIATEFEQLASNLTTKPQENVRGNNSPASRGNRGMRGNPRGMRGNPNSPGPARGNRGMRGGPPRGRGMNPRGRGASPNRQRNISNSSENVQKSQQFSPENKEKVDEYKAKLVKLAEELQTILFTTNIEEIDGCETATKFVPTAKSLLTEMTQMESFLNSINSKQVAKYLKKTTLDYIHICKENFLQEMNENDKKLILTNKTNFFGMLENVVKNQVPTEESSNQINQSTNQKNANLVKQRTVTYCSPNVTSNTSSKPLQTKPLKQQRQQQPQTSFTGLPQNQSFDDKPKVKTNDSTTVAATRRSNTVSTDQNPRCVTMFSAASVPKSNEDRLKRDPTFHVGGARRGTITDSKPVEKEPEKKNDGFPKPLSRTDQRIRAVDEIFSSEKVYLSTLQRLIWVKQKRIYFKIILLIFVIDV